MNRSKVTSAVLVKVAAGESVRLPVDARNSLFVMRVGNQVRLTPTGKMVTIKAPGAPGGG